VLLGESEPNSPCPNTPDDMKISNITTESITSTDLYEVLYLYAHEQYVHFMIPFYFHLTYYVISFSFS